MLDFDALAETIHGLVAEQIRRSVAPLLERIAVLEARAPVGVSEAILDTDGGLRIILSNGEAKSVGRVAGRDGVSPEIPDVAGMVRAEVERAMAQMTPEIPDVSGLEAGQDALKSALAALEARSDEIDGAFPGLRDEVRGHAEAMRSDLERRIGEIEVAPRPESDAPKADEIIATVRREIEAGLARDFTAVRGEIGEVSARGTEMHDALLALGARVDAIRMPEVIHGRDGAGLSAARINDDGELILKWENGETCRLGKIRGDDGMGFDDLAVEHDGDRGFALVLRRGEREARHSFTLPVVIDRGVWRDGAYERGDAVTWAGSLWIARRDTTDKPESSDAWRLAVKRGRDGKAAQPAKPKPETVKR